MIVVIDCKIAHELLMPSMKARGGGGEHIFDGQQVFIYSFFILFGRRVLQSNECVSGLELFPFGLIAPWNHESRLKLELKKWICKNKIGHMYIYDKIDITASIPRGSDYVDNHYELKYMTPPPKKRLN